MEKQIVSGVTRADIYAYASEKYGTEPDHPWAALPLYAVLRRPDNKKWYAVIMNLGRDKLGLNGDDRIDIAVIKCDAFLREILLTQKGFLPAYHMNRENWITVLLDGSADREKVFGLLDESFTAAKGNVKKTVRLAPTSFLAPANPKYYDVIRAFSDNETILWKQSNAVIVGDTIYLYVAAPYSCIMYKCEVVEADIPYKYDDGNVRMDKVMKIKRLYTYAAGAFGRDELKEHGIVSVRGPRSVPYALRRKLEKASDDRKE